MSKKQIEFRTFKNYCHYHDYWDYCDKDVDDIECKAKSCPVWKKLKDVKSG